MIVVVLTLAAAATAQHSYQRTRLGRAGALAVIALDGVLLAAVPLAAPALAWPLAAAAPVSAARIVLVLRMRVAL